MFARVETFEGSGGDTDELLTAQQRAVGRARTLPGNMGGFVLVNRDGGKLLTVTYWDNEENRGAAEAEFGESPQRGVVELYAIAMQEAMTP